MFIELKRGVLKNIISSGFKKAGNIHKLAKELGISKSSLSMYHLEKRVINEQNLEKLLNYLSIKIREEEIIKRLSSNWKQIKGGTNCVRAKKERGVFEKQMRLCHKNSSNYMKNLHKRMKREQPEKYYKEQYEKFKKIGGYKYITNNGEKVRNNWEKEVADMLKSLGVDYQYEPLIKIGNKAFFPDFFVSGDILIECTAWRGYDKAIKLREKIKYLKKYYKVYVVIPKGLYNYYQIIDNHLVLGLDEFVPLAQTFPRR
jgi:transcriptional regulator with XRE-family HTH domain